MDPLDDFVTGITSRREDVAVEAGRPGLEPAAPRQRRRSHSVPSTSRGTAAAVSESLGVDRFRVGVLVVFLVVMFVVSLVGLPSDLRAARGEGPIGTFVSDHKECGRASCDWRGTFTSDDRTVYVPDAWYDGNITGPGQSARGHYVGTLGIYPGGGRPWLPNVIMAVLTGGTLLVWGYFWFRRRRRAHQPKPTTMQPSPGPTARV